MFKCHTIALHLIWVRFKLFHNVISGVQMYKKCQIEPYISKHPKCHAGGEVASCFGDVLLLASYLHQNNEHQKDIQSQFI